MNLSAMRRTLPYTAQTRLEEYAPSQGAAGLALGTREGDPERSMRERSAENGRQRRRVALLLDAIEDDYQAALLRGAAQAAQQEGLELWCLAGGVVSDPRNETRRVRNFVFDLLRPSDFAGVLVLSGSLSTDLGVVAFDQWLARFRGVPTVSVGVELASCQNVIADGATGMREVLEHLIQQHHHRRIGFIRGPASSFEAEERFAVYRETLAHFGIAEDPRLVLQGNWLRDSGAAAVRELFDERGMAIDAVSAIACANDSMALGAIDALRHRGVSIPSNIAVTGFDDGDMGKCAVPPLTTVQQPTEAMGREGMRRLLALMNGEAETHVTRLPTALVSRRSCGCGKATVLLSKRSATKPGRSLEAAVLERRSLIFAELARSARGTFAGAGPRWEERLVTALLTDLRGHDEAFISALDQLMAGLQRTGGDVTQVQPMLGTLRRLLRDCAAGDVEGATRVDDLLDAARELVGEWFVRGETLRRMEVIEFSRALSRVSGSLLRQADGAHQRTSLEEGLRRLSFHSLSLGLFAEPGRASEQCRCLAALEPSGRTTPESHFRSSDFSPPGVFDQERAPILVQALVYDEEPLGLLTVPLGLYHASLYEQMRDTFAIGLRGFRLAARQG
jgi:DNA-binding LacI/PurR family transcriptional regulator